MHGDGKPRPDFVLNMPAYCRANVLIAGPNFGCGSSREHAVWGMQQYGFKAVIASSYGEIFYSNAMNNRLMLVTLPEEQVQTLMRAAESETAPLSIKIDIERLTLETAAGTFGFQLAERYRRMYLDNLDLIGMSLTHDRAIQSFAEAHWARQPWLKDVARRTRERLAREGTASISAG